MGTNVYNNLYFVLSGEKNVRKNCQGEGDKTLQFP